MIKSVLVYIILNLLVLGSIAIVLYPIVNTFSNFLLIGFLIYLTANLSNFVWNKFNWLPKDFNDPKNKAVLITGCDTGFGHRLAKRLNEYGYFVYAGCLFPYGEGASKLIHECNSSLRVVKLDVTNNEDVSSVYDTVSRSLRHRKLWAVVNNAGILITTEVEIGDMENFIKQMDINCMGIVRVTKAFLPLLRLSQGRIVNVASLAGRYSIPGMVAYSMSKASVISFSEGLRRELKKWNIDVITIEPHLFKTNLCNDKAQKDLLLKEWQKTSVSVRKAYGDEYLDGFLLFLDKILGSARPQIDKVVNIMFNSVTHKFVAPSYTIMGDFERFRVWLYNFIPDRALDQLSSYLSSMYMGKPALMKLIEEKKIKIM